MVLVANGPSLNLMALDFLKDEVVIGMNKIFLGFRKFKFYPRYYVAVNKIVLAQSAEKIKSMNCVKFVPTHSKQIISEDALTYHIETRNPQKRFSDDISVGVHEGWTVTYVALQIALFLGFKEVVIIGMDHHYAFSGQPNERCILEGPDTNHFTPDYFGGGQLWDNPDLNRSEESYIIARSEFEKKEARIIDATLGGSCNIFQKADYRSIFGVKN